MFNPGDKLTVNVKAGGDDDKMGLVIVHTVFFIGMWVNSNGYISKNKAVVREATMAGLLKVIDVSDLKKEEKE